MEWVETTGRTLEEAIEAALDELGVAEGDLEYEVLDEPKSGLLGRIGGREARIRARVKPLSREKPGDRRRREKRSRPGGGRGGGSRSRSRDGAEAPAAREGGGRRPSGSRQRRRRPRRPAGEPAAAAAPSEGAAVEESDIPIQEQAETAEGFTRGVVEAFGADAKVEARIDDAEIILVDVTGPNLGLLVGPRGATLSALEELVRTVVQRHTGGHGARINVDVAGYRAKRREALSEFTRDLARKVLESGQEQALEPMSASDRKVVHDAVAEMDGVTTGSEGEEPRRRVVIRPA
ncbi:MAG TPA: RNA-binding cell elongation regulator Jag/EloR [Gemmatimonadales bacterium]|nr:RNA-binding cell elongation regulator Jag/EloR [Gemmatimonadales bacterium]